MVLTQNDEYKETWLEYFLKRKDEVSTTFKKIGVSGTVLMVRSIISLFPNDCI